MSIETEAAIAALSALAHPTRLDAFRALVQAGGPVPAGALAERLGVPPSTLSFHLKELRRAGVLRAERRGRSLLYSADFGAMRDLCAFLLEGCCGGPQ